jgi:hypothetical protein
MMDCVLPSRSGRTGAGLDPARGQVNIKNARHADDPRPLDEDCTCPACRSYSRAYLHHVFRAGEIIASMLLTWHNLHYFQELMGKRFHSALSIRLLYCPEDRIRVPAGRAQPAAEGLGQSLYERKLHDRGSRDALALFKLRSHPVERYKAPRSTWGDRGCQALWPQIRGGHQPS